MKKIFIFFISIIFLFCGTFNTRYCKAESLTREIPILMYHQILKSRKSEYIVSPQMFEEDLEFLKSKGYEPIFVDDIIYFCEGKGSLPDKPVVISFDDGHYNNFFYAYPIIKEKNFKANLNIIGSFCEFSTSSGDIDNPNYSYLTWQEIKELHDSNFFEIGNHTYKMHNFKPRFGIKKKANESDEEYRTALTDDIKKLEDKLLSSCGFSTHVFAYPFGAYSKESEEILKGLGFKAFLTCNEGVNKVTFGDSSSLTHLKRINRTGLLDTKDFFEKHKIS